jgi:hypothetical protein
METALVAAALIDPANFLIEVQPHDFHDEQLAALWRCGCELVAAGQYVDGIILGDTLRAQGEPITEVRLAHLAALDVDCTHASAYADRVRDLAARRKAFFALQEGVRVVHSSNGTWRSDLAAVTSRILPAERAQRPAQLLGWTAAELLDAQFPEPQWAIPGLIPVGLTFLAGRPKVGKSWFALQTAIAVGTGGRVLDRDVPQGRVLYLALEDNGRRLKERVTKQGMPKQCNARFLPAWPRLAEGGLERLAQVIEAEGYSLVIVDTLGRFMGKADTNDYGDMTTVVGSLQEIAITRDMAILVIDHHRKSAPGASADPVDDIVGSTGKSGAADAILGLTKEQGKRGATLRVTGRDVEEQELALTWDALTCCWQYEGTAEEVQLLGRRGQIVAILQENYPNAMTLGEVAKAAEMQRQNVSPILNDLVLSGHAKRLEKQGKEQPFVAVMNEG